MHIPLSLDFFDIKLGINYPIYDLVAGVNKRIPIPGLSLTVPDLGNVGVDVVVDLAGNLSEFDAQLGVDACGTVFGKSECGSDLTKRLPLWILDKQFNFSGAC